MKLLLDQNLSHRLLRDIDPAFPGSQHVADFNLTAEVYFGPHGITVDFGVAAESAFCYAAASSGSFFIG